MGNTLNWSSPAEPAAKAMPPTEATPLTGGAPDSAPPGSPATAEALPIVPAPVPQAESPRWRRCGNSSWSEIVAKSDPKKPA